MTLGNKMSFGNLPNNSFFIIPGSKDSRALQKVCSQIYEDGVLIGLTINPDFVVQEVFMGEK